MGIGGRDKFRRIANLHGEAIPFVERSEREGRSDCRFSACRLPEQEDEAVIDDRARAGPEGIGHHEFVHVVAE